MTVPIRWFCLALHISGILVGLSISILNPFLSCFWSTLMLENTVCGQALSSVPLSHGWLHPSNIYWAYKTLCCQATARHDVRAISITLPFLLNILSLWRLQNWWVIFSAMSSPSTCQNPLRVEGKIFSHLVSWIMFIALWEVLGKLLWEEGQ